MANPAFHRPATVEEAVALLGQAGEGGVALAGGATLVALMNARLVEPGCIVSLSDIPELREFAHLPDGSVRIGAMRRHRETAFESDLRDGQRVLSAAAAQIANPPVRNMGTLGGSICFADPAADYPPALVAADARIEMAGADGRRTVLAEEFFVGWYETVREPGEIVTAVILPPSSAAAVGHYEKICRVAGDFALASIAVVVEAAGDGAIEKLRFAVGGCGGGPVRAPEAEAALVGAVPSAEAVARANEALQEALDPIDDVRGSAEYRRRLVPRLLLRALETAVHSREPA